MAEKEACAAATAQTNEDDDVANLEQEVTEGNWTRPEVSCGPFCWLWDARYSGQGSTGAPSLITLPRGVGPPRCILAAKGLWAARLLVLTRPSARAEHHGAHLTGGSQRKRQTRTPGLGCRDGMP